ncbi:neprilysin-2-like isoform X2 [Stegodyphus dumicola]|uniref:neprilysin-2-like isoform X2 n=1 Tax=Stegodyphus dumicola TaxID=202533 RepID=UPI0015AD7884|nr:neprilysin-2-like isoform X2 [Stegodyphus dumicola]
MRGVKIISIVITFTFVVSVSKANSGSENDSDLATDPPNTSPSIDSSSEACQSKECIRADILEKRSDKTTPKYIIKLRDFYRACMLADHFNFLGKDPLKWIVEDLGGWPLVMGSKWNESAFDWMDSIFKLRKIGYGHNAIMKLTVEEDPENRTANILKLEPSLRIDVRNPKPFLQRNIQGMNKAALDLYSLRDADRKEIIQSLHTELTLSRMAVNNKSEEDAPYKRYTVAEFINESPKIDWLRYFRGIVGYDIGENETILVTQLNFFRLLGYYLEGPNKRELANYIIWQFIQESLGMLYDGRRLERCLPSVRNYMGVALSAYYLQEYFEEEKNQTQDYLHVKNITTYILQAFEDFLRKAGWMDKTTKVKAMNKARDIEIRTEYPIQLLNHSYLSDLYSNLSIDSVMYFFDVKSARLWKTDRHFLQLLKPNIKGNWEKYDKAPSVKPYYNYLENSIEFPVGVFLNGFFKKDQPSYLNFGALGYLIGREIVRSFDRKGQQIDENGNKVRWWPFNQITDINLEDEIFCATEEYFNYTTGLDSWINAEDTLFATPDDYMAYSSGLKVAYEGYKKWSSKMGEELKLPGLDYTPKQLFWISAANMWCERAERFYTIQNAPVTTYPNCYKATAGVVSIPEFAEDFGCARPQTQCRIW